MKRWGLALLAMLACGPTWGMTLADASGRMVEIPDRVAHVMPVGAAGALLLGMLAPDTLVGWPATGDPPAARAATLHPDLIVVYGPVGTPEVDAARALAARTGLPLLLIDGALRDTPHALRVLGTALGVPARGETLAKLAEAMLAMRSPGGSDTRVLLARGPTGLDIAAPGTPAAELFGLLGWTVVAPQGTGPWRVAGTVAQIAALDPDVIVFQDPAMRDAVHRVAVWRDLRAVASRHAYVAPAGWAGSPDSATRLLGLVWLSGADAVTAAAMFDAVAFGQVLAPTQLAQLRAALRPIAP